VFVTIGGQRYYLWRAVDQDGDVLDILVQKHRDKRAAKRFLCSPYGCVSSGWKSRPGSGLFTQVVITDSWEGNRTWASSVVKVPSPSRKQRGSPQVGRATMQAVA
jgi:hypothetical protein